LSNTKHTKDFLRIKMLRNFSIYFKKKNGMRCMHQLSLILLLISSWTYFVTILT